MLKLPSCLFAFILLFAGIDSISAKDYVFVKRTQLQSDSVAPALQGSDSIPPKIFSNASTDGNIFTRAAQWCNAHDVADNLSVGVTLGSGGIGLELSTPITRWVRLRTGVEWVPSFTLPLNFELSSFSDDGPTHDVGHIQQLVKDMMGLDMDDRITMDAKPNLLNYKLLFDVFPFRNNRHWHFTAGFYIGSPVIGRAKNNRSEMQTLVGVNIYNRAYKYFTSPDFDPFMVNVGNGTYLDPDIAIDYHDKFERYGSVGIHIGNYKKDGKPYVMTPTTDGRAEAKAVTNNFRPYLGFGYSGTVDRPGRLELGFEAGALFWGGVPNVILHDGVNMTKDLTNIRGKVGDYMDIMRALPVYPILNFKISYTIF